MAEIVVNLAVRVQTDTLGLDPAEHLALSMRSHATASGECACGAVAHHEHIDEFCSMVMEHEPDCPAISTAYDRATAKVFKQIVQRVMYERFKNR